MDQYELQFQNDFLPVDKQHRQLLERGTAIIRKLWDVFRTPPFDSSIIVSSPNNVLRFYVFGQEFQVVPEFAFTVDGRVTDGFLKTYFRDSSIEYGSDKRHLLNSILFDRIGNIDNRFTLEDFAVPYFLNVIKAYKNYVYTRHDSQNYTIILQ